MKAETVDYILLCDNIFTGLKDTPEEGGIAIAEGKILFVGEKAEVLALKNEHTQIMDFGNKLLMTGFHDAHVHFSHGCMMAIQPLLYETKSARECAEILKSYYEEHKNEYEEDEWLLGYGFNCLFWDDKRTPHKNILDEYFPDKPVLLLNSEAHAGWVNSVALAKCGINKNTPDPDFGQIFHDESGEPSGYLAEFALAPFIKQGFSFSPKKRKWMYKNGLKDYAAFGITSVNDMLPCFGNNDGYPHIWREMDEDGELTLRIHFANNLFDDPEYTLALKEEFNQGKVIHNGLKEFFDGVITSHTSMMLAPYADNPDLPKDFPTLDYELAAERIIYYQKLGYNIHLHATGDGAVRFAIDCYENAIKANGFTKSRLSIEHLELIDPSDLPRMGKNKLIASMQPEHLALNSSYESFSYLPVLGIERTNRLWPLNSLAKNGAILAFGSDYPVVGQNPMNGIYQAINRLFPDKTPKGGFSPQEKISLPDALRAYTLGGAKKCGRENLMGTLETGKFADIVVLDANLFAIAAQDIPSVKAVFTMVNGEIVFKA